MICRRCGKSIPDSAEKCPYCYKRTKNGWKREGEKLVEPITKKIKKIKLPF